MSLFSSMKKSDRKNNTFIRYFTVNRISDVQTILLTWIIDSTADMLKWVLFDTPKFSTPRSNNCSIRAVWRMNSIWDCIRCISIIPTQVLISAHCSRNVKFNQWLIYCITFLNLVLQYRAWIIYVTVDASYSIRAPFISSCDRVTYSCSLLYNRNNIFVTKMHCSLTALYLPCSFSEMPSTSSRMFT